MVDQAGDHSRFGGSGAHYQNSRAYGGNHIEIYASEEAIDAGFGERAHA